MSKPFEPFKPEKKLTIEVSVREIKILEIIRRSNFGKFTIHKANGVIVRIEKDESILIDGEETVEVNNKKVVL